MKEDKLSTEEIERFNNSWNGVKDFIKSYEATGINMELKKKDYVSRDYLREKVSALIRYVDRLDNIIKEEE